MDKFYAHVWENDKIYYEEIVNNIDNKADKEITTNKILFSLRRKDKKISGISIEKEVESMLILYKLSTEDIEEKYWEPSKIIHPNSFYLLNKNQGNKFDLFFENNLELLIWRLSHINNIHIPVILNSFSWAKTNIY